MNKSWKSVLAALVVGGLAFSAAAAEGDIYSVDLVDDALYGGKIPSASSPLTIGEKTVIRVRLANSNWYDTSTGGRPWMVKPTDAYAALGTAMQTLYPLKLGIKLGGQSVYASFLESSSVTTPADTYTDLYFTYTVKPGDLAMPAQLMNDAGEAASSTSSADYFLLNANYWQIINADGKTAVFHFTTRGDEMTPVPSQPQNYSVSGTGMGLYVKTVDFDTNYVAPAATSAEESVWRRIHKGRTSTTTIQPTVEVNGNPPTDVTMYLWVEDETVAAPLLTDGATVVTDKNSSGSLSYTRTVLPVSFPANSDPTKSFKLRGLEVGKKTKVCLSSSQNLVFDDMGSLVTNWVERVIEVVTPPDPYPAIEVLDRSGANALSSVTVSTNYWDYVAILKLTLNGAAPTDAVKMEIDLSADICPADENERRVGISESSDPADLPWLDRTLSVTFHAGETEKYLYLYALDQTADLVGKVTFTPVLSGPGAADFTGDAKSGNLTIKPMNPVIFSPAAGEVLSEAIAGDSYRLDLVIGDSYRRMRQDGWTIQLRSAAFGDSKWNNYTDEVLVDYADLGSGEASLRVIFTQAKEDADLEIRVVDPADAKGTLKSATVKAKISVSSPRTTSATFDRGTDSYAESRTETAKAFFTISQPSVNAKALYAFLKPLNDDATNKVSSTAFTTSVPNQGVYIGPGELDSGANYAKLALDDGDCSAMYEVVVCSTRTYSKLKEVSSYAAGQCVLNVTNVIPAVRSVSMGYRSMKVSGGVMSKSVAQNVTKTFTIDVDDPGRLDLEATGDDAFCVKWTFSDGEVIYMWGDPSTNSVAHTFTTPGEVEVEVQCQDKDMRKNKTWTEPFTFTVNVLDAPRIMITQKDNRKTFSENDTGDSKSRFYVQLNVAPDFTNATDRLYVDLAVECLDDSAFYTADDCVLSQTSVEFASGVTSGQAFYLMSLDGTADSAGKGFRITAKVRSDSAIDVEGKIWTADSYGFTVANAAPTISCPIARTDAEGNPISAATTIGETQSVAWSVNDVDADVEGLSVLWVTSEGSRMEYVQGTGTDTDTRKYVEDIRCGTHTFSFAGSGMNFVTMAVTDKDGGLASSTLYYTVAAPKASEAPFVAGDSSATVTGNATSGWTVAPSEGVSSVEVTIPDGVDASKVTVEVSPDVAAVTPHGAKVKVVRGGHDITDYLDVPSADAAGSIDLTKAAVKEAVAKEAMAPEKGAKFEVKASKPMLTTSATKPGLTYTLREGTTLDGMSDGASKLGDGSPWTPEVKVKGGASGFYSIKVTK